jgi:hypothetical protein
MLYSAIIKNNNNMRTFIFIVVGLIIGLIVFNITSYFHTQTFTAKVSGKERVTEQSSNNSFDSYYLVYTDHGTLKLEDDIFRGNWHSSDVYGSLRVDSTYTFKVSGYRFGFFSMYPNIIEVK